MVLLPFDAAQQGGGRTADWGETLARREVGRPTARRLPRGRQPIGDGREKQHARLRDVPHATLHGEVDIADVSVAHGQDEVRCHIIPNSAGSDVPGPVLKGLRVSPVRSGNRREHGVAGGTW